MKPYAWAIAGVMGLMLVLETSVLPFLTVRGVRPDLILILVISLGLLNGPREGALAGFAGGLLEDLLLGRYVGVRAISKMIAGYLAGLAGKRVYRDSLVTSVLLVLGGTIISEFLSFTLWWELGSPLALGAGLGSVILPLAVFNAMVAPFIYAQVYRRTIHRRTSAPESS